MQFKRNIIVDKNRFQLFGFFWVFLRKSKKDCCDINKNILAKY